MTATSSRLLELLSPLQVRRKWWGSELADRLKVSRRAIRRDVERLHELGYPVESLTGPAGGYRHRVIRAAAPLTSTDWECRSPMEGDVSAVLPTTLAADEFRASAPTIG